jgi:hypothetical protein
MSLFCGQFQLPVLMKCWFCSITTGSTGTNQLWSQANFLA